MSAAASIPGRVERRCGSILEAVARRYEVAVCDLRSQSRDFRVAWARHVGMWLVRELTSLSLARIAYEFGRTDHTTVLNAIGRVERGRDTDEGIRQETDLLREKVAGLPQIDLIHPDLAQLADELLDRSPEDRAVSGQTIGLLCTEIRRLDAELRLALARLPSAQPQETKHD